MRYALVRSYLLSFAVVVGLTTSGCESKNPITGPPTVPVKLKVTLNGSPLPGSQNIRLLPEPPKEGVTSVSAVRTSDGGFALQTYNPGDGAPPGTYMVKFGTGDMTDVGASIPQIKPKMVIIPNEGGEVLVELEGTGKDQRGGMMPPPRGQ